MPELSKTQLRAKAKELRALARQVENAAGGKTDSHRETMAERSRAASVVRREIGPLPAVKDPERRERCRLSFLLFNETDLSPWIVSGVRVILCPFFEGEGHEAESVFGRADR